MRFLLRDSLCLCICCLQRRFYRSLSSCSRVFMASMRTCLSNYCCIFSSTFRALTFYWSIMFIEFMIDRYSTRGLSLTWFTDTTAMERVSRVSEDIGPSIVSN